MKLVHTIIGVGALCLSLGAAAQTYDSGSTGALGALTITAPVEIVLPEDGVLDYTSVTIDSGKTVTFKRNAANTPVIIRVTGDVTINGIIDVNGAIGTTSTGMGFTSIGGLAGPGGGDGGSCDSVGENRAGGGHGPGGGRGSDTSVAGGGASPIANGTQGYLGVSSTKGIAWGEWNNQHTFGGSGGGCGNNGPGSGGGGMVTIAASGTITLNGTIRARGGASRPAGGGGGGGVIRLVATTVTGNGTLDVRGSNGGQCAVSSTTFRGGCGGDGFTKVEAYNVSGGFITSSLPADSVYFGKPQPAIPGTTNAAKPRVAITGLAGASGGTQDPGEPDWSAHPFQQTPVVFLDDGQTVTVTVTAWNVEPGKVARVRFNMLGNLYSETNTAPLVGTFGQSSTTANLTLSTGTRLLTVEAWILDMAIPSNDD